MKKLLIIFSVFFLSQELFPKILSVDFDTSMDTNSAKYKKKYKKGSDSARYLAIFKRIYYQHLPRKLTASEKPRIPLIVHQIWVGEKPVPISVQTFSKTWLKFHPKWEYKLWRNEDAEKLLPKFAPSHRELYLTTTSPEEKANILRLYILAFYGGLYVDADFECRGSFDELNHMYDFYTGIAPNNGTAVVNNALIAAIPEHPVILETIKNINPKAESRFDRAGCYLYTHVCARHIARKYRDIAFPITFFYPIPLGVALQDVNKYFKPETLAVHYWANHHKELFGEG